MYGGNREPLANCLLELPREVDVPEIPGVNVVENPSSFAVTRRDLAEGIFALHSLWLQFRRQ